MNYSLIEHHTLALKFAKQKLRPYLMAHFLNQVINRSAKVFVVSTS